MLLPLYMKLDGDAGLLRVCSTRHWLLAAEGLSAWTWDLFTVLVWKLEGWDLRVGLCTDPTIAQVRAASGDYMPGKAVYCPKDYAKHSAS